MAGLRVLLVDDDEFMREQVAYLLQHRGNFEIREASTGAEAMQCLREELFDYILSDFHMPGMNGREVLAAALLYQPNAGRMLYSADTMKVEEAGVAGIEAYEKSTDGLSSLVNRLWEVEREQNRAYRLWAEEQAQSQGGPYGRELITDSVGY